MPLCRPCLSQGCPALVPQGEGESRCPKHAAAKEAGRGTRQERGYTDAWLRYAKAYLAAHPLCVECNRKGRLNLATCVDHKVPHRGDMKLFWDDENHQGLCHECHSRKTASEDGGFGNERRG